MFFQLLKEYKSKTKNSLGMQTSSVLEELKSIFGVQWSWHCLRDMLRKWRETLAKPLLKTSTMSTVPGFVLIKTCQGWHPYTRTTES